MLPIFPDGIVKDRVCEEIRQVNDAAARGASAETKREAKWWRKRPMCSAGISL